MERWIGDCCWGGVDSYGYGYGGRGFCFVVCLRFVCLFGSILFVFVIFS